MPRIYFGLFSLALLLYSTSAQTTPPPSDPQAVAFAQQGIAALTGGTQITDVTLSGNVNWIVGTDSELGTATLLASGTGESRMDLVLASGTRTEIRDNQTGVPLGKWVSPAGASGMIGLQNMMTDAAWFFPVLGSLAAGNNVVLSYVGQETRGGQDVQHIQSYVFQPADASSSAPSAKRSSRAALSAAGTPVFSMQSLTTMDFYLDPATLVPVAVTFNSHPDDSAQGNLLTEIDFSNYQSQNGGLVPMHIQRFLQGNLQADITITTVAFNTGLPLSDFTIN